ncbi:MAG: biotin carboxylase N-terminal domain-containing protein [Acidimicrobiales bacterium]
MGFDTLLVANRGEVALRILRTARRLGLRTVAVYSDADRGAPHVAEADRAVRLGPAPAAQSYLSAEAVLRAARREGAGAVHPGYGFLSESAAFAAACESAGLVFVGPQPAVIDLMSRKDRARHVAGEAGAPVVPAIEGLATPGRGAAGAGAAGALAGAAHEAGGAIASLAARVGAELGFPALVKAVAGGGGKGMRVVEGPGELGAALAGARREALAAFGDASLFVERYLPAGRHLEVQVVGDGAGHVLHLSDRDCSVQRRHQKVVEEAPASVNPETARARAFEAAVRIAEHVRYRSLGTVEFLAVGDEVYFLEMNTRLQVEHPVTEAVTGVDLVELQLRLAAGEPLPFAQEDVAVRGHAIEARVYAEDAEHGFLPQAGQVTGVRWPGTVRVDAALQPGQEVGTDYDPMLAKLVAHGLTRETARRKLVDALDSTAIFGLTTNLGFLRRLIASDRFARAEITTSWLDGHAGELGAPDERRALVAAALFLAERARLLGSGGPWAADGWRLGGPPAPLRLTLGAGGRRHQVLVRRQPGTGPRGEGALVVEAAGEPAGDAGEPGGGELAGRERQPALTPGGAVRSRAVQVDEGRLVAEMDGAIERFAVQVEPAALAVCHRGEQYRFELGEARDTPRAGEEGVVVAPLPGTLVSVEVAPGDAVRPGQVLGVLESMKMEHPLKARLSAKVERVGFSAGAQVARGDVLFELSAGTGSAGTGSAGTGSAGTGEG